MSHYIDIIIPCHNCGKFLEHTLQSLWIQKGDFTVAKVLIINDSSSDTYTNELLELLATDSRLRILQNNGKRGAGAARNVGLRESHSEWVMFLDGDDVLPPNSIERRIEVINEYPDIGWIGGDITSMDEAGMPEDESFFRSRPRPRDALRSAWSSCNATIFPRPVEMFIGVCVTSIGASLVRRRLIEDIGGFSEELWQAEDYQLWIKLATIADFAFIPQTLLLYRQHADSTMASDIPPRLWTIRAFEQLTTDPSLRKFTHLLKRRISDFHIENASYYVKKRQYTQAAVAYLRAFLKRPNMRSVKGIAKLIPKKLLDK